MEQVKMPRVELFDTSLRDGLQQPNLEISVPSAVHLLQRMGAFGVHFAEIGFAGANQFVVDLTQSLERVDTGATRLALFGRTRGKWAKVAEWPDLEFIVRRKQRVPIAVIVAKSRLLDVEKSHTVMVIKRSMNPGFAGIDNPLYYMNQTLMLFGDAKAFVSNIVKELGHG